MKSFVLFFKVNDTYLPIVAGGCGVVQFSTDAVARVQTHCEGCYGNDEDAAMGWIRIYYY